MPAGPVAAPPLVDAAAGVASLRTLGTGATQAAAGNDARFSALSQGVSTLNDLKAQLGSTSGSGGPRSIVLAGRLAHFDGGEGQFIWTTDTTTANDDVTVVVPTVGGWVRNGCWKRVGADVELRPEWWGVKPDDTAGGTQTANVTALQSAINKAWADSIPLRFAAKGYFLNGTINLPNNGLKVLALRGTTASFGAGAPGTVTGTGRALGTRIVFTQTNGTNGFLFAAAGAGGNPCFVLSDIAIIGCDYELGTANSGSAWKFDLPVSDIAVPICKFENVKVGGFKGATGLWLAGPQDSSFIDCHVEQCQRGWYLTSAFNGNAMVNCDAQACTEQGVVIDGSGTNSWTGGVVQSNSKTGLLVNEASDWTFGNVHFENNNSSNTAGKYAVELRSANNKAISGLRFSGCRWGAARDRIYGLGFPGFLVYNIVIEGGYANLPNQPWCTLDNELCQNWIFVGHSPASVLDKGTGTTYHNRDGIQTHFGYQQLVPQADRTGVADASTHVTNAVANLLAFSGGQKTFNPAVGTYLVANNAVDGQVDTHIQRGTVFKVGAGSTFTVNSPLTAGRYQIFDVSALNSKVHLPATYVIRPEWFKRASDPDDTLSLQACLNYASSAWFGSPRQVVIELAAKTYTVSSMLTYQGNASFGLWMRADTTAGGPTGAVIQWAGAGGGTVQRVRSAHTNRFENICWTGGGTAKYAFHLSEFTASTVFDNCLFSGTDTAIAESSAFLLGELAGTQASEVEFRSCRFGGGRRSFTAIGGGNVCNIVFTGYNTFMGFTEAGIHTEAQVRQLTVLGGFFGGYGRCFVVGSSNTTIIGTETEMFTVQDRTGGNEWLYAANTGNNPGEINLIGNRVQAQDVGNDAFPAFIRTQKQLFLQGNFFQAVKNTGGVVTGVVPWIVVDDSETAGATQAGAITSINNHYDRIGTLTYAPIAQSGGVQPINQPDGDYQKLRDWAVVSLNDKGSSGVAGITPIISLTPCLGTRPTWPGAQMIIAGSYAIGTYHRKLASGVGAEYSEEHEFDYQAFQTGATTITRQWSSVQRGWQITRARVEIVTPFAGTGITGVTASMGVVGAGADDLVLAGDATVAARYGKTAAELGVPLQLALAAGGYELNDAADTPVSVTLNASGANLSSLTAGKLRVKLTYRI